VLDHSKAGFSHDLQDTQYCNIHGYCSLPRGYELALLPSNAKVDTGDMTNHGKADISSSYNVPKAIIAIVQTMYASVTLYHTRGDQIQRYGYASFGLTVIPYVIMSIMNLSSNLIVPDYPTLYLVRSLELDEARVAGGEIDGTVGRLDQSLNTSDSPIPGRLGTFGMDDGGDLVFWLDERESSDPHHSGDGTSVLSPETAIAGTSNDAESGIVEDEKPVDCKIHVPSCARFKTMGSERYHRKGLVTFFVILLVSILDQTV